MEKNYPDNGKKKLLIIGGVALVVLVVIALMIISNRKNEVTENPFTNEIPLGEITESVNPLTVPEISQNLPAEAQEVLKEAKIEAPGASLITKDDKVVNDQGVQVRNDAQPMTPEAPRLTAPIKESDLASSAIKLKATSEGFSPKEFTVKSGEPVTLSLTSVDVDSRLVFRDPALVALEIPCPVTYTMAKTFNAPAPGSYEFYQDIPGRSGETGTMIVK